MAQGPNPLVVGWSVLGSLLTVRRPGPFGGGSADHGRLAPVLDRIAKEGTAAVARLEDGLDSYLAELAALHPDELTRDEALAYWLNAYNAGALALAGRAVRNGETSVLGVPGGFQETIVTVDGETLSLDDIEHGKLRRFRDPRIHAALICGSVSCPTLQAEPFTGTDIDRALDGLLRDFLSAGACSVDRSGGVVSLSRVFLWFGSDFARPNRMPSFLPASRRRVLGALVPWLDAGTARWIDSSNPRIEFQPYDWGIRCVVRPTTPR